MDKTLERILSLLPRKADGSIKHGAKAAFARSIGYDGGEIVTMWENGTSNSYRNKLYEIATKYGVSVEWLRGEEAADKMDITLERILSLLPRKEDGSYQHGAKAELGRSIGYTDGHIVAMWESGSSTSYKKKLHEIAAKYGVSVEWLRGETDERGGPVTVGEDEDELREYLEMLRSRPECRMLLSTVKGATKEEVEANVKFIEALRGMRGNG